jgi:ADP-heptose:LPS heptosyltransferase
MRFRNRILLDRVVATPAALVLGLLARLLGSLLRRDHSARPEGTRHVVVAKLVGMGSIVQATPLLRALGEHFPNARVTVVTLLGNRELVSRLPHVHDALYLDDTSVPRMLWTTAVAIVTLARGRVDHYLDLEVYSAFASLLAGLSLARNRVGFHRHSSRFKRLGYTHLVYFNTHWPVRRLYLQLARVLGAPLRGGDELGEIRVEDADRRGLRAALARHGVPDGRALVVVNVNASDLLLERRWPASSFGQAIDALAGHELQVVLIGAPAERAYVREVLDEVPSSARAHVSDLSGALSLGELFALLELADCVLTNDTGPMHFALALRRPTVCLFGPVDPNHYGVDAPNVSILYEPVSCSPCVHEVDSPPCRGDNVCMKRIDWRRVVEEVLRVRGTASEPEGAVVSRLRARTPLPLWTNASGGPLGVVLEPTTGRKR